MRHALRVARAAGRRGEVPVGAVAVLDGRVLAAAGNRVERGDDALLHAEVSVLRRAARVLGSWRLTGVTVAVTLEPCPMCAGALLLSRVSRVIYGAADPRKGADGSAYDVLQNASGNHHPEVVTGVLGDECGTMLSEFFREARRTPRYPEAVRGANPDP